MLKGDPDHIWKDGLLLFKNKQFEAAKQAFSSVCEMQPESAGAWVQLGLVEEALNRHKAAFHCYQKAVGLDPTNIQSQFRMGVLLGMSARYDDACTLFQRILKNNPDYLEAKVALGGAHKSAGRFDIAEQCFLKSLAQEGENFHALMGLVSVYLKQGRYVDARRLLERLPKNSASFPDVRDTLAATYIGVKDYSGAEEILREQVSDHPDDLKVVCNLSSVLLSQGKAEEAVVVIESLGVEHRNNLSWKINHAKVLSSLGDFEKAAQSFASARLSEPERYRKYIKQLAPHDLFADTALFDLSAQDVHASYWIKRWDTCDWQDYSLGVDRIRKSIDQWISDGHEATQIPPVNPFNCLTIDAGEARQAAMVRAHTQFVSSTAMELSGQQPFTHNSKECGHRKLKIGYISPDFRDHPIGILLQDLFQMHDRERFLVHIYSTRNDAGSKVARSIQASSDRWTDLSKHSNHEAARCIFNDELDILVDLAGYTNLARPEILAFRPAPVQLHYIGCPGPMNAPYIDYQIASPALIPKHRESNYDEKIVRLNDCYHFVSAYKEQYKATTRKEHGLPKKAFVYCCFNSPKRIEPILFSVWMEILHAVPESVLWLRDWGENSRNNLTREASDRGIEASRLVFAPDLKLDDHIARSPLADIYLDTRIYSGFTMLTMALWQKVPLISAPGETLISRLGASALHQAGLGDLCAEDLESYKELAIALGTDVKRMASVRSRMKNVRQSPLFDREGATRQLESAYVEIARRYHAGEEPVSFDVGLAN